MIYDGEETYFERENSYLILYKFSTFLTANRLYARRMKVPVVWVLLSEQLFLIDLPAGICLGISYASQDCTSEEVNV